MPPQPWWHTLITFSGWLLACFGVALLLWAFFADRSRGRRRCPKCWYDMTGVPGLTCPECGRTARREKRLFKTRRRWRRALMGVPVFLAAYLALVAPRIDRNGWSGAVPNLILAIAAPIVVERSPRNIWTFPRASPWPGIGPRLNGELGWRVHAGELARIERIVMYIGAIERVRARETDLGPRYDDLDTWLRDELKRGEVPSLLVRRFLDGLARRTVRTRSNWPLDTPLELCIEPHSWPLGDPDGTAYHGLGSELPYKVTVSLSGADYETRWSPEWFRVVDKLDGEVLVVVTWSRGEWKLQRPGLLRLSRAKSLHDVLAPVSMPGSEMMLANCMVTTGLSSEGLFFDNQLVRMLLPPDIGFAAECELLADGRPVETTSIDAWRGSRKLIGHPAWFAATAHYTPPKQWRVRIVSNPTRALRELGCDQYWQGEVMLEMLPDGSWAAVK